MDPYGDRNLTSPLRKKKVQPEKPAEKNEEKIPELPIKKPDPPVEEPEMQVETLVDHLGESN